MKKKDKKLKEFDFAFPDGRFTMPSDGKHYNWKALFSEVKKNKRPLSKKEMAAFLINA